MRHVIIGAGEIGSTIAQCLIGKYTIYDKGEWESIKFNDICTLHICIPYSVAFVSICKQAIAVFRPKHIIIHSTVKPGTTAKVDDDALYSPVNGRHADGLVYTVKSYPKLFAGDEQQFIAIADMFDLRCHHTGTNRDELEFAKVSCTTYMGWCLVYEKELTAECERKGYNRELVYTAWNRMYNDGMNVTHSEWKRPVYDHVPGKIGGHCIVPNLDLVKNDITEIVRKYARKYNHPVRKSRRPAATKPFIFSASKDEA